MYEVAPSPSLLSVEFAFSFCLLLLAAVLCSARCVVLERIIIHCVHIPATLQYSAATHLYSRSSTLSWSHGDVGATSAVRIE